MTSSNSSSDGSCRSSCLLLGLVLLAGAAAPLTGCIDRVDAALRSCPCATGNVCCASGICADSEDACGTATAALSASVQGEWEGYIENFLPGYEDRIRISVAVAADGALSGTVTSGGDTAPPPPSDPKQPWPPGHKPGPPPLVSAVPYTALDIAWSSRRLKMRFGMYEPWHDWCALQAPFSWEDGTFHRYPDTYFPFATVECTVGAPPPDPIPCDTISLSEQVCQCAADGCRESKVESVSLDIAFKDRVADGSINFSGNNYALRLTRSSGDKK